MTKKLFVSGLALSFLLSCSRNDNETINNVAPITNNKSSKKTIDNFVKDYSILLNNIVNSNNKNTIYTQIDTFAQKYNYKYSNIENNYTTLNQFSRTTNYELNSDIVSAIRNSEDDIYSIINSLTNLKDNHQLSEKDYLIISLLIETLKIKSKTIETNNYAIQLYNDGSNNNSYITYAPKNSKAKCAAETIGKGIGGAIAGCGVGGAVGSAAAGVGALPGCVVGGVLGFIGGALEGYGSSDNC